MTDAGAPRPTIRYDIVGWPTPGDGNGLYLYGIIGLGGRERASASTEGSPDADAEPIRLVERGDLAAIVRTVSLAEFDPENIRERAEDPAWLSGVVQQHNAVISAVHEERPILPARFGSVYASADDLVRTLEASHDRLVAQLERLNDADEWGIHVYADRTRVEARVAAEDPSVRNAIEEIGSASAGRAYFLRRKLLDQIAEATDQALVTLAQTAFDRLLRLAVDGEVSSSSESQTEDDSELEILRAAFLVRRCSRRTFLEEAEALAEETKVLRCEYSGPWPPYSFAIPVDEEA